jgi:hypothetical protein
LLKKNLDLESVSTYNSKMKVLLLTAGKTTGGKSKNKKLRERPKI